MHQPAAAAAAVDADVLITAKDDSSSHCLGLYHCVRSRLPPLMPTIHSAAVVAIVRFANFEATAGNGVAKVVTWPPPKHGRRHDAQEPSAAVAVAVVAVMSAAAAALAVEIVVWNNHLSWLAVSIRSSEPPMWLVPLLWLDAPQP